VILHHRATIPDEQATGPRIPVVGPTSLTLARLELAATAVAVTLGTVVTSTGPHGGDPAARRFGFSLHSVAQLHGTSVEVLLALTLLTMWTLTRASTRAPAEVIRRAEIMLIALVAQGVVGYAQYFNGDPMALVAVHVAGACVVVVAVLRFYLGLSTPVPLAAAGPATRTEPVLTSNT
jgi:cytochrome c oxidase assembly protein subunit 15